MIFLCVNNVNERVNVGEVGGKIQRKSHPGLVVCHFLLPVVIRSITGTLEVASWRTLLFLPVLLASPPPPLLQLFLDLDAIKSPFLFLTELACAPYP